MFFCSLCFSALFTLAWFLTLTSQRTRDDFPRLGEDTLLCFEYFRGLRRSNWALWLHNYFFTARQNYQNSGKKISLPNLFKFVLLVSRKGNWALLRTRRFHNKKFQLYLCAQRRGGSVAGSASLGLVENECWRCGRLDAWWFLGTATGWGNVIQWCFRQISPVLHGDGMNAIFELKASQSVLICKRSQNTHNSVKH